MAAEDTAGACASDCGSGPGIAVLLTITTIVISIMIFIAHLGMGFRQVEGVDGCRRYRGGLRERLRLGPRCVCACLLL